MLIIQKGFLLPYDKLKIQCYTLRTYFGGDFLYYFLMEKLRTICCIYYIASLGMLVKVNDIDIIKNKVKVTQLDIDDYGSIIPLKELELNIPDDKSIIEILQNSSYAAIFTEANIEENNSTIILANGMTMDELNNEKNKTIDKVANKR
jgi:hypothetical protein